MQHHPVHHEKVRSDRFRPSPCNISIVSKTRRSTANPTNQMVAFAIPTGNPKNLLFTIIYGASNFCDKTTIHTKLFPTYCRNVFSCDLWKFFLRIKYICDNPPWYYIHNLSPWNIMKQCLLGSVWSCNSVRGIRALACAGLLGLCLLSRGSSEVAERADVGGTFELPASEHFQCADDFKAPFL